MTKASISNIKAYKAISDVAMLSMLFSIFALFCLYFREISFFKRVASEIAPLEAIFLVFSVLFSAFAVDKIDNLVKNEEKMIEMFKV